MKTIWLALCLSMLVLPASAQYYRGYGYGYYRPAWSGNSNPYRNYYGPQRYAGYRYGGSTYHRPIPQYRYDWSWGGGDRAYTGGRGGGWGGEW